MPLRALEPSDLDLLYEVENDQSLWSVADAPTFYSRFALWKYLKEQPRDFHECGELRLVFETEAPAAFIDLTNYSASDDRAEVSIAVFSAFRGRGVGLAALRTLEAYAHQHLHLHQLYAHVAAARNEPAHRLFLAAGYRRTATLAQWHRLGNDYEDIAVYQKTLCATPREEEEKCTK